MTTTNHMPQDSRPVINMAAPPVLSKEREARLRRHHPRLLLAEDDHDFRRLLQTCLEVDGYRVTGVATGSALLDQLRAMSLRDDPPALVISDDRMPGMRGLSVLRQARDWGWTLPLVLITAFGTDGAVTEAKRIGVRVVRKPFDIGVLRTLVGYLAPPVDK